MIRRFVMLSFLAGGAAVASPGPQPLGAFVCEWCEKTNWYCLTGVGHVCVGGGHADRWCLDWPDPDCDLYPASLDLLDPAGAPLEAPRYMAEGEDARRSCDGAVLRYHMDEQERASVRAASTALSL